MKKRTSKVKIKHEVPVLESKPAEASKSKSRPEAVIMKQSHGYVIMVGNRSYKFKSPLDEVSMARTYKVAKRAMETGWVKNVDRRVSYCIYCGKIPQIYEARGACPCRMDKG